MEADEPQVVDLWQRCGLVRPWNDPRKDIARKLAVQRDLFLVGTVGDRLVATVMAGYDGHRGWLYYVAVAGDRRGDGLGRALVEAAEQWLAAQGARVIRLMVRAENEAVTRFYEALGYEDGEMIVMGKRL